MWPRRIRRGDKDNLMSGTDGSQAMDLSSLSGADPDGPTRPDLSDLGPFVEDGPTEPTTRARSRSSSFYGEQDGQGPPPPDECDELEVLEPLELEPMEPIEGFEDLDFADVDRFAGRSRSRSTCRISIGSITDVKTSDHGLSSYSERDLSETLNPREHQALEDGLEDASRRIRGLDVHSRANDPPRDICLADPDEAASCSSKIKVLLLGDRGVGKTALMTRWADGLFRDKTVSSEGVDFRSRREVMQVRSRKRGVQDRRVQVQVWDLAATPERLDCVQGTYCRRSQAVMLVVDASRPVVNLTEWIELIQSQASQDMQLTLLLNKIDVVASQAEVKLDGQPEPPTVEAARSLAAAHDIPVCTASAKTGEGVNAAFGDLALRAVEAQPDPPSPRTEPVMLHKTELGAANGRRRSLQEALEMIPDDNGQLGARTTVRTCCNVA